jgi:hypothetical protein
LAIEDFTLTTLGGSMSCIAIVLPTSAALAAADSIALKHVYQKPSFSLAWSTGANAKRVKKKEKDGSHVYLLASTRSQTLKTRGIFLLHSSMMMA